VYQSIAENELFVQTFAAVVNWQRFAKDKALRSASTLFTVMVFDNADRIS
jgi:hypothetical protein